MPYLDHCDFSVELGLLCTDDDDNDELNEMYGLLCWQDYERDPGGFKKLMWYGIMKDIKRGPVTSW